MGTRLLHDFNSHVAFNALHVLDSKVCQSWVWTVLLNFQSHACLLRRSMSQTYCVFSLKPGSPAVSPSQVVRTLSFQLLRSTAFGLPLHSPLLHSESGLTKDTVRSTFCIQSEQDYTCPPHRRKPGPNHIIFCLDDCSRLQNGLPGSSLAPTPASTKQPYWNLCQMEQLTCFNTPTVLRSLRTTKSFLWPQCGSFIPPLGRRWGGGGGGGWPTLPIL